MGTMALLEELANEGDHIHVASRNRKRLLHIAEVGKKRFGLRIGEFVPYDIIDCVHTTGSWHYRRAGFWWLRLGCPGPRGRRKRKNLAIDASGHPKSQQAFFAWLLKRYGRPSGWFQP